MTDISMAAARLKPEKWIAEINGILGKQVGLNSQIRKSWTELTTSRVHDGNWHKRVQAEVVIPYNLLHGSWAGRTSVAGKFYLSLSASHVRGLPNWCTGSIMPGGYATLCGGFGKTSKSTFKGIWSGTYVGRGTHVFHNTRGDKSITLQHNNFEARTTERIWYSTGPDRTIYALSDHVDSNREGQKALANLMTLVTGWLDSSARPIKAGFLDLSSHSRDHPATLLPALPPASSA